MSTGYFEMPLWIIVTIVSLLLALIGYIWHTNDKRIDDVNNELKKINEKEIAALEKGKPLTMEEHGRICSGVVDAMASNIGKLFDEKLTLRDKWLEAKLDALKEQINFMNRQSNVGLKGPRGVPGRKGLRGPTGKSK